MLRNAHKLLRYAFLPLFCLLWFANLGIAQVTSIQGKVTDAGTGEPISFASVYFKGIFSGTKTNSEGRYAINTSLQTDSLTFSFIGYKTKTLPIKFATTQVIDVQMEASSADLQAIVVHAKNTKNPAHVIIEKVVINKPLNDKRYLQAYEYESYSKIELNLSHLPSNLKKQKLIRTIYSALDSNSAVTKGSDDLKLPVFISETLSRIYYRESPRAKKEEIIRSKVKGIGLNSSEIVSQLLGSNFQDYNFYDDWLPFLERKLVSPIGHSWKFYYNYELADSSYIDGYFCYKIDIQPKRVQDLAFEGTIWITKKDFALKQINVRIGNKANLNFVDELQIVQRLKRTEAGNWLPEKTKVLVAGQPFQHSDVGFLMKHFTSIKDEVVNQPRTSVFYAKQKETLLPVTSDSPEFWSRHRHDSLTITEEQTMQLFDSVNANPEIKRSIAILRTLGSGYLRIGKVDVGPFPLFYIRNNVEQNRIGFGLKTNQQLFRNLQLSGLLAYGTRDRRLKHNFAGTYFLSRRNWTVVSVALNKDIEQVGLDPEEVRANYFYYASSKWGKLDNPYRYTNNSISLQHDFWKGVTLSGHLKLYRFDPLFPFSYQLSSDNQDIQTISDFSTAEVGTQLRLSKNENFISTNYSRISVRNSKWPVLTIRYSYGLKGILNGDFEYHKLELKADQRIKLGVLGTSRYTLDGGTALKPLPYPLLYVHTGNESIFYTAAAYSLMNYMEFVSDRYMSLRYQHNFDGFLLNSLPGISKLNLRLLVQANVLYGALNKTNAENLAATEDESGFDQTLRGLTRKPYVELGYGIENIFRFIRVDAFHRLTYLQSPQVRTFGIKVSAQFKL